MNKDLNQLTDEELIYAFQNDQVEAFEILVRRYKDPLMNYIYRYVGNYDDCADILQETFLRLYRKKHLYKSIAKFSTWLYTIAINLAKTELKKKAMRSWFSIFGTGSKDDEYEYPLPDPDPTPDNSTDSTLKKELIQKALLQLPPAFREAVILRDIQDLTYEDIAEISGLPIGTVKSRINRGRKQLQILLKEFYD